MSKITYRDLSNYKINNTMLISATGTMALPGGIDTERYSNIIQEMVRHVLFYNFPIDIALDSEITQPDFLLSWNTLTDEKLKVFVKKETAENSDI